MQDQLNGILKSPRVWGPVTEVGSNAFITPSDLATAVGYYEGTWRNETSSWLKFELDKIYYIALKPLKVSCTWAALNEAGIVTGQKIVVVNGKNYKVRLMTGATQDPVKSLTNDLGGEYSELFVRCTQYYEDSANRWGNLNYDDVDWYVPGPSNGAMTICKEVGTTAAQRVVRGYGNYSASVVSNRPRNFRGMWIQNGTTTHTGYAWRPILELIP